MTSPELKADRRRWQKEVDALWYRVKTRDVYRSVIMHRCVGAG